MAGLFTIKLTRKPIFIFTAISALLIVISVASLLYLNHTINRLSDSLFKEVYENSELILNADRDLYQADNALLTAISSNLSEAEREDHINEFKENNLQAQDRVRQAGSNINSIKDTYQNNKPAEKILTELENELLSFNTNFAIWMNTADTLITDQIELGGSPISYSTARLDVQLNEARVHLDQAEELISSYALHVTDRFQDKKSVLFALYSILLFVLFLVIIYLGRRIIWLRKTMLEDQTLYHLIGETMSDFIILTDPNGLILYASPSHLSVLGYIPKKGDPLSNYIREPEIAWAKLKSVVQDTPRISELRMRGAEGHWVWLETKVSPIRGSLKFPAQFMLVSREITQRKQYEERLHKLAFYDHLTAIPNRAHFKMYMENLLNQPIERRQHIALALLDCDRFKQLNDSLGHLAGDEFLQLLSRELMQTVKGAGQAFRIGGDEFAVVLHRFTSPEMLDEMLQRLLKLFNKSWSIDKTSSFHTSASIGVALYPEHGSSINELLRAADLAMYRSKDQGGNVATLYYELMDEDLANQTTLNS